MTLVITTADVLDGFSTSASTADLEAYIAVSDQSDVCLTTNAVPDAVGRQLKILGVRHLATNASDRGTVTSERAVSGAGRTYADRKAGETGYMETLRTLDQYGCVLKLISNNGRIQLRSAGRRSIAT